MHSYAGMCSSEAVKDPDKASRRKQGEKSGVIHLISCYAFVLAKGMHRTGPLNDTDLP